jgi:farnesyl-diphosphate farnesyltransferase
MSKSDVTRGLLKSVSRSFYLSIRVLPKALRETVALGYLMARISDTIADLPTVPAQTRLRRLGNFEAIARGIPSPRAVESIQRDIMPEHPGEAALINALPQVLDRFAALNMWEWKETSELLGNIIRGQSNDLETFTSSSRVIALPDAAALEDYIYLVAGCVGEWWTRLCFHHLPKYSRIPEEQLMQHSDAFGKALQLVNILRDFPNDLASGRCYLPADELQEINVDPLSLRHNPENAEPIYFRWLTRAREYLEQARLYIAAVRTKRVRIACYLPWRLASETLDLIKVNNPLFTREKVKVSRRQVRAAMWSSIHVAFSNKPLGA